MFWRRKRKRRASIQEVGREGTVRKRRRADGTASRTAGMVCRKNG
jgi:hypothetical protein